jgi:CubicO group peptidase (beta-lactamase class C family)
LERQAVVIDAITEYVLRTQEQLGDCPSAVVVSLGREVLHEAYYPGVFDGKIAVDEGAMWPIFSATKTYVAALLLHLCEEKVLGLDDPVVKHLPAFGTRSGRGLDRGLATVRHLASHTSGIDLPEPESDEVAPDLEGGWIETAPGDVFNYAWQGMHVLQCVIEAATGERFPDVLYVRVLNRVGLEKTRYLYEIGEDGAMLPREVPDPEAPEKAYSIARRFLHPHSGLYATAREFNRFGQFWQREDRAFFSEELRAEMLTHHSTRPSDEGKYGLLTWVFDEADGFVVSGAGSKVMGVAPGGGVVMVLRLPQRGGKDSGYDLYGDKVAVLEMANEVR